MRPRSMRANVIWPIHVPSGKSMCEQITRIVLIERMFQSITAEMVTSEAFSPKIFLTKSDSAVFVLNALNASS